MSFLRSCGSDCYNAIASLLRDLSENLAPVRGRTGALPQAAEGVVYCHSCRVFPTFAFSMLRHANHLLSADYINYGKISIQIKDKFSLEMRDSTNEGKTTTSQARGAREPEREKARGSAPFAVCVGDVFLHCRAHAAAASGWMCPS